MLNCGGSEGDALQPRVIGEQRALIRPCLSLGKASVLVLCMCLSFLSAGARISMPEIFLLGIQVFLLLKWHEGVDFDRAIFWITIRNFLEAVFWMLFYSKARILLYFDSGVFFLNYWTVCK